VSGPFNGSQSSVIFNAFRDFHCVIPVASSEPLRDPSLARALKSSIIQDLTSSTHLPGTLIRHIPWYSFVIDRYLKYTELKQQFVEDITFLRKLDTIQDVLQAISDMQRESKIKMRKPILYFENTEKFATLNQCDPETMRVILNWLYHLSRMNVCRVVLNSDQIFAYQVMQQGMIETRFANSYFYFVDRFFALGLIPAQYTHINIEDYSDVELIEQVLPKLFDDHKIAEADRFGLTERLIQNIGGRIQDLRVAISDYSKGVDGTFCMV